VKLLVLGGFLGAGKTTAARAMARLFHERGERVAIITNDQGESLVDTALCESAAASVTEIGGGCFCCRYPWLEQAIDGAAESGASIVIAEAVGSCTDLIATVMAPLASRRPSLTLLPYAVLVDPQRVADMAQGRFDDDVRYLFDKQIEEADIVVLTRADAQLPDAEPAVRALRPGVSVVRISGLTGEGLDDWLNTAVGTPGAPLDIDYDRYAAAEALLGWSNGRADVRARIPFSPRRVIDGFLQRLWKQPIAHVKVAVAPSAPHSEGATAVHVVRGGDSPHRTGPALADRATTLSLIVNARAALAPETLDAALQGALTAAAGHAEVTWTDRRTFSPSRPVPVHRLSVRCGPGSDAACCAGFYAQPTVRYLLGDSFHPGGERLTLEVAEHLALPPDADLLDVACGQGTSLRAIAAHWPVTAVGLDACVDADTLNGAAISLRAGDAHAIPFEARSFDAVLCECALSTFADQARALAEIRRVLRPGGRVVISDMVLNGELSAQLMEWVHLGTCLTRAMPLQDYAALAAASGLEIVRVSDTPWAMTELLRRLKKALLGAALAKASGLLPRDVVLDVDRGRAGLREAEAAVADGLISYGYVVAVRPAIQPRLHPL